MISQSLLNDVVNLRYLLDSSISLQSYEEVVIGINYKIPSLLSAETRAVGSHLYPPLSIVSKSIALFRFKFVHFEHFFLDHAKI